MMFGRGIEAVVDVSFGGLAVGIMLLGEILRQTVQT